jgi:transglutaminase TgpA-like protein/transglutaminase superfamily protein
MERLAGTSARSQRLIGFAAAGLLAVATAWAFGRVFSGAVPTWKLLATGLLSAAVAVGLQRRNLILATFASLGVLAVVVAWLVFPSTTWNWLPSLETLDAVVRSSHLVTEQARAQAAPTAPLTPLLLAAVVAMWAAIFSSHALAVRAGSPLLALLPPVALLGFADTVLEEDFRPLYGLPFLAAALIVAFADAIRRVVSWGTVWVAQRPSQGLLAVAARGVRPVAASVLVAAALSPAVLPGFGSGAVIDLNDGTGGRVGVDPFVDIRDALTQSDVRPVFRVDTPQPAYLRMLSLDSFDGGRWKAGPSSGVRTYTSGAPLPPLTPSIGATMDERITAASDLSLAYLPVPYPPSSIEIDNGFTFEFPSNAATANDPLDEGDSYLVRTSLIRPTPEALQVEPAFLPPLRDLQLPTDLPVEIRQLARAWTFDARTTYDRVLAIQDRLTDTRVFTYDDSVAARSDSFTLRDFLFTTRRGFCQQFSSAMAVMLRTLGIPSRVAVGFTSGHRMLREGPQAWEITTQDAHAWVEVWFPSFGWLAFEPTPGRINPVASVYASPVQAECPPGTPGCGGRPTGGVGGGSTSSSSPIPLPRQVNPPPGFQGPGLLPPQEEVSRFTWRAGLGLVVGVAILALAVIPPARWLRRRLRIRRAHREPRRLILATYDLFADRAADLGHGRHIGETIEEYRRRVPIESDSADEQLDRLTSITTLAAYAPGSLRHEDALVARDAAETALKDLRRNTPLPRRVAGMYGRR